MIDEFLAKLERTGDLGITWKDEHRTRRSSSTATATRRR